MRTALTLLTASLSLAWGLHATAGTTATGTGTASAAGEDVVSSVAAPASSARGATSRTAGASSYGAVTTVRTTRAGADAAVAGARTPVRRDGVYTGTLQVRARTLGLPVRATLSWYDGTGRPLLADRVASAAVLDTTTGWTTLTVSGLAPARATRAALGVAFEAPVAPTLHDVRASTLTRREQGSRALAGPLTTKGNRIVDAHGAPVVLRGFNRPGQWDTARPGGLDEPDIAAMKAWGANVVRLTLGQQLWLPGCPDHDPAYAAAVDQAVRWVTERGMLAVLDLHFGAPTCSGAGANPMPDTRSVNFWTSVATRYRNAPLVAFDLYNEPFGVSPEVWLHGGPAVTVQGRPYTAVGMQTLYDAVRGTGARNLVLVGGLARASMLPGTARVRGTDVVWAVHAYNCDVPWRCSGPDSRWLLSRFDQVGTQLPVVVSEFGFPAGRSADGTAFNAGVIAYAEARGWGWAAWAWDVHGTCLPLQYFNLLSPGTCGPGTGTFEPSPSGIPVLRGLAANR